MQTDKQPNLGFIRETQVLEIIPIGRSTLWAAVKAGRFPKPVKLSAKVTAWRVADINAFVDRVGSSPDEAEEG